MSAGNETPETQRNHPNWERIALVGLAATIAVALLSWMALVKPGDTGTAAGAESPAGQSERTLTELAPQVSNASSSGALCLPELVMVDRSVLVIETDLGEFQFDLAEEGLEIAEMSTTAATGFVVTNDEPHIVAGEIRDGDRVIGFDVEIDGGVLSLEMSGEIGDFGVSYPAIAALELTATGATLDLRDVTPMSTHEATVWTDDHEIHVDFSQEEAIFARALLWPESDGDVMLQLHDPCSEPLTGLTGPPADVDAGPFAFPVVATANSANQGFATTSADGSAGAEPPHSASPTAAARTGDGATGDSPNHPDGPDGPENPTDPGGPHGPENPTDPDGPDGPENPTDPGGPHGPEGPENPRGHTNGGLIDIEVDADADIGGTHHNNGLVDIEVDADADIGPTHNNKGLIDIDLDADADIGPTHNNKGLIDIDLDADVDLGWIN